MGPRNLLILFFSTLAVSLVILIILFSLFFKNVDLNFETKLPDSAPDLEELYGDLPEADKTGRASVKVPEEYSTRTVSSSKEEEEDLSKPLNEEEKNNQDGQSDGRTAENPEPDEPENNAPPTPPAPKKEEKKPEEPKPEPKPAETSGSYQVFVGGFSSREAAQARANELGQGLVKGSGGSYIVQLGVFSSKENADNLAGQVGGSVRKLD